MDEESDPIFGGCDGSVVPVQISEIIFVELDLDFLSIFIVLPCLLLLILLPVFLAIVDGLKKLVNFGLLSLLL